MSVRRDRRKRLTSAVCVSHRIFFAKLSIDFIPMFNINYNPYLTIFNIFVLGLHQITAENLIRFFFAERKYFGCRISSNDYYSNMTTVSYTYYSKCEYSKRLKLSDSIFSRLSRKISKLNEP